MKTGNGSATPTMQSSQMLPMFVVPGTIACPLCVVMM
jgi:hypothetical protein